MGLLDTFRFGRSTPNNNYLPDIFPFPYAQKDFVRIDVMTIYSRILNDVLERTEGIPEKYIPLLSDNCLASEAQNGLVTLVATAMAEKKKLFLIYDKATNLVVKADNEQQAKIEAEYKASNKSELGIMVNFTKYCRTDMMLIYSALEYCTVASLDKSMNLSKAIQLKLKDLRASVSSIDKDDVEAQMLQIAQGLAAGKDVGIDKEDIIETAKPDLTATQSAMEFITEKRAFYLGLPRSYLTGDTQKGLGDSGEGDSKKVEQGLRGYYFSIIKPIVEALFEIKTTFKTEDFRMVDRALNILRTMEATSEEFINAENKLKLVNKAFGFPENTKGGPPATEPEAIPGQNNGKIPPKA